MNKNNKIDLKLKLLNIKNYEFENINFSNKWNLNQIINHNKIQSKKKNLVISKNLKGRLDKIKNKNNLISGLKIKKKFKSDLLNKITLKNINNNFEKIEKKINLIKNNNFNFNIDNHEKNLFNSIFKIRNVIKNIGTDKKNSTKKTNKITQKNVYKNIIKNDDNTYGNLYKLFYQIIYEKVKNFDNYKLFFIKNDFGFKNLLINEINFKIQKKILVKEVILILMKNNFNINELLKLSYEKLNIKLDNSEENETENNLSEEEYTDISFKSYISEVSINKFNNINSKNYN